MVRFFVFLLRRVNYADMNKDVALVLSSGGPRGWAYIGAIEELISRGYNITSIAGTSIGSLVGGIYAAGKLEDLKEWLFTLNAWKVFNLMDLSISKNHIIKGDRVINALKEIVPEVNIEELSIPYRAIAADLYTGEEVVFDQGPLFDAIRASISIPSLFRPVKYAFRTLVDGGIVNTMPIDKAVRNGNDIVVAFDVNDIDVEGMRNSIIISSRQAESEREADLKLERETKNVIEAIKHNDTLTFGEKLRLAGSHSYKVFSHKFNDDEQQSELEAFESNYYSILSRTFSIMNHTLARQAAERFKPEILVKMPFDAFDEIGDYARAKEISEAGRHLMKDALDKYENNQL